MTHGIARHLSLGHHRPSLHPTIVCLFYVYVPELCVYVRLCVMSFRMDPFVYIPLLSVCTSVCVSFCVYPLACVISCVPPMYLSFRVYLARCICPFAYLPCVCPSVYAYLRVSSSVCMTYCMYPFIRMPLLAYDTPCIRPSVCTSVRLYVPLCTSCMYVPPCYVRTPYVSLCVCLSISTSLRVYILSWVYPPCVSLYMCPSVYMSLCMYIPEYVPCCVSRFVFPSGCMPLPCLCPFTYLWVQIYLIVYISVRISLRVYISPYVSFCMCALSVSMSLRVPPVCTYQSVYKSLRVYGALCVWHFGV